jgi:hypothetical protein
MIATPRLFSFVIGLPLAAYQMVNNRPDPAHERRAGGLLPNDLGQVTRYPLMHPQRVVAFAQLSAELEAMS